MVRINVNLDIDEKVLDKLRDLYITNFPNIHEPSIDDEDIIDHFIQQFGEYGFGDQTCSMCDSTIDSFLSDGVQHKLALLYGKFNPDKKNEYEDSLQGIHCLINVCEELASRPEYETVRIGVHSDGSTLWVNDSKGCIIRIGNVDTILNPDNHMKSISGIASESKHMIDVSIDR